MQNQSIHSFANTNIIVRSLEVQAHFPGEVCYYFLEESLEKFGIW